MSIQEANSTGDPVSSGVNDNVFNEIRDTTKGFINALDVSGSYRQDEGVSDALAATRATSESRVRKWHSGLQYALNLPRDVYEVRAKRTIAEVLALVEGSSTGTFSPGYKALCREWAVKNGSQLASGSFASAVVGSDPLNREACNVYNFDSLPHRSGVLAAFKGIVATVIDPITLVTNVEKTPLDWMVSNDFAYSTFKNYGAVPPVAGSDILQNIQAYHVHYERALALLSGQDTNIASRDQRELLRRRLNSANPFSIPWSESLEAQYAYAQFLERGGPIKPDKLQATYVFNDSYKSLILKDVTCGRIRRKREVKAPDATVNMMAAAQVKYISNALKKTFTFMKGSTAEIRRVMEFKRRNGLKSLFATDFSRFDDTINESLLILVRDMMTSSGLLSLQSANACIMTASLPVLVAVGKEGGYLRLTYSPRVFSGMMATSLIDSLANWAMHASCDLAAGDRVSEVVSAATRGGLEGAAHIISGDDVVTLSTDENRMSHTLTALESMGMQVKQEANVVYLSRYLGDDGERPFVDLANILRRLGNFLYSERATLNNHCVILALSELIDAATECSVAFGEEFLGTMFSIFPELEPCIMALWPITLEQGLSAHHLRRLVESDEFIKDLVASCDGQAKQTFISNNEWRVEEGESERYTPLIAAIKAELLKSAGFSDADNPWGRQSAVRVMRIKSNVSMWYEAFFKNKATNCSEGLGVAIAAYDGVSE